MGRIVLLFFAPAAAAAAAGGLRALTKGESAKALDARTFEVHVR
jgi:hypothetical protein